MAALGAQFALDFGSSALREWTALGVPPKVVEAVAELRAGSGTQFDPAVGDALIAVVEDAALMQAA